MLFLSVLLLKPNCGMPLTVRLNVHFFLIRSQHLSKETKYTCLQYIEPQNLLSLLMNSRHQVMIRGVGTLVWMSSDVSIRLIPLKCKLFPVFRC